MKTSEQIGELVAALALAKTDYKILKKSKFNPFFKSNYADLSDVIEATESALAKQGLVIIQSGEVKDGRVAVHTLLAHKSGQWVSSELSLKSAKDDAQAVGSTMTYGLRYSWQAIVGITGEPDDDGNHASEPQTQVVPKPKTAPAPAPAPIEVFRSGNDVMYEKLSKLLSERLVHVDMHEDIAALLDGRPFTIPEIAAVVQKVKAKK